MRFGASSHCRIDRSTVAGALIVAALGAGCAEGSRPDLSAASPTADDGGANAARHDGGMLDASSNEFSFEVERFSLAVPQPAVGFNGELLDVIRTPEWISNFGLDGEGGIVTVAAVEAQRNGVAMIGTRVDRLSPSGDLEWTRVHFCVRNLSAPGGSWGAFTALGVDAQGNALLGGAFSTRCNVGGIEIETAPNPTPRYQSSDERSESRPYRDGVLFRHTRDGQPRLIEHFGGPGVQEVNIVDPIPAGGFNVAGKFEGEVTFGGQSWLSPKGGLEPVSFRAQVDADGRVSGDVSLDLEIPAPTDWPFHPVDSDGNGYFGRKLNSESQVAGTTLDHGSWLVSVDADGALRWARQFSEGELLPGQPSVALSGNTLGVVVDTTFSTNAGSAREGECLERGIVSELSFAELSLDNELIRGFTLSVCGSLNAWRIYPHPQGGWMFRVSASGDYDNVGLTRGTYLVHVPAAK